jgi:2-haloalkanoic acid dehalogenase type II
MSSSSRPLTSFRLLSFDIYGTLIDWETGILEALSSITARLPNSHPLKSDRIALAAAFNKWEREIQAQNPRLIYSLVLKASYKALARELRAVPLAAGAPDAAAEEEEQGALLDEEGGAFAASIAYWPAFPDSVEAMRKLKASSFRLVALSNVDRASFAKTLDGPLAGLHEGSPTPDTPLLDAAYTAQDIGSYKPDLRNFNYLIARVKEDFDVGKDEILHVAQSLFHDHEPAKKIGLQSAWIARGEQGVSGMGGDVAEFVGGPDAKAAFGWRFSNLAELAEAIEKEQKDAEEVKNPAASTS